MSDSLMIEVANLTKRYAWHTAVSDLSRTIRCVEKDGEGDDPGKSKAKGHDKQKKGCKND